MPRHSGQFLIVDQESKKLNTINYVHNGKAHEIRRTNEQWHLIVTIHKIS